MAPHNSNFSVLVTGGTGTLGRHVAPLLNAAGLHVRVLSRHSREPAQGIEYVTGDLGAGTGVDAAVDGVEVIMHLAGSSKGDDDKARHLARAAARAGSRHLVYISVVGADRVPIKSPVDRAMFGYFSAKLTAERIVAESGVPWTTLRATQFHQSMLKVAQTMSRLPVIPAPPFRFQPVDASEVATRLVELALGPPAGLVPDLGGPQVHRMADLFRSYLRSRGKHRLIMPVPVAGEAATAFKGGANLAPERGVGLLTWEDVLTTSADPSRRTAPTSA